MEPSTPKKTAHRASGLKLLQQVYDELYQNLSDEFSELELLRAAQILIETTDAEYATDLDATDHRRAGYFSTDVYSMIANSPWLVCASEQKIELWDDYRIDACPYARLNTTLYRSSDNIALW